MLGPLHDLSAAGQDAYEPQIASDAEGDAVAAWGRDRIQARTISAAGVLGPVQTLSDPCTCRSTTPQVASDADGDAVAVWASQQIQRVEARTISAAGVLGPVQTLSFGFAPQVASEADGDAVAVWTRRVVNRRIQTARGP